MLTGKQTSEFLESVASRVAAMASTSPPNINPKDFGVRVAAMLAEDWGGVSVYIPKNQGNLTKERNKQIYADFSGNNTVELALQYGLSEQRIYTIVKLERSKLKVTQGKLL